MGTWPFPQFCCLAQATSLYPMTGPALNIVLVPLSDITRALFQVSASVIQWFHSRSNFINISFGLNSKQPQRLIQWICKFQQNAILFKLELLCNHKDAQLSGNISFFAEDFAKSMSVISLLSLVIFQWQMTSLENIISFLLPFPLYCSLHSPQLPQFIL